MDENPARCANFSAKSTGAASRCGKEAVNRLSTVVENLEQPAAAGLREGRCRLTPRSGGVCRERGVCRGDSSAVSSAGAGEPSSSAGSAVAHPRAPRRGSTSARLGGYRGRPRGSSAAAPRPAPRRGSSTVASASAASARLSTRGLGLGSASARLGLEPAPRRPRRPPRSPAASAAGALLGRGSLRDDLRLLRRQLAALGHDEDPQLGGHVGEDLGLDRVAADALDRLHVRACGGRGGSSAPPRAGRRRSSPSPSRRASRSGRRSPRT